MLNRESYQIRQNRENRLTSLFFVKSCASEMRKIGFLNMFFIFDEEARSKTFKKRKCFLKIIYLSQNV